MAGQQRVDYSLLMRIRASFARRSRVRGAKTLSRTGACFFAAITFIAVANSEGAYAQSRAVGNFRYTNGSFHGRPGFASNRRFGNGPFRGWSRFHGGFGRRDFGTNIVVVPSAGVVAPAPAYGVPPPPDYGVPPAPYYGVSPPGQDSLRCYLHRHVQTPNGPALEPVYVC
jgi:hypothetical protein